MIRLTLYTRPGCHLCDAMKGVVDEIAREGYEPVTLREVDISGDMGLERRFGAEVPVLVLRKTSGRPCPDDPCGAPRIAAEHVAGRRRTHEPDRRRTRLRDRR